MRYRARVSACLYLTAIPPPSGSAAAAPQPQPHSSGAAPLEAAGPGVVGPAAEDADAADWQRWLSGSNSDPDGGPATGADGSPWPASPAGPGAAASGGGSWGPNWAEAGG